MDGLLKTVFASYQWNKAWGTVLNAFLKKKKKKKKQATCFQIEERYVLLYKYP